MRDVDVDAAKEIAAVGRALAGEEKAAPIEKRYPEAPPEVLDTIELVEERLEEIEARIEEKERKKALKKESRRQSVVDLLESVEQLEAKVDRVAAQGGH